MKNSNRSRLIIPILVVSQKCLYKVCLVSVATNLCDLCPLMSKLQTRICLRFPCDEQFHHKIKRNQKQRFIEPIRRAWLVWKFSVESYYIFITSLDINSRLPCSSRVLPLDSIFKTALFGVPGV